MDDELELEFKNLLRDEERRNMMPVYESLDLDRRALKKAFDDHVVSILAATADMRPDFFLSEMPVKTPKEVYAEQEELEETLGATLLKELDVLPELQQGQVSIEGGGVFHHIDEDSVQTEFFTMGEMIQGDIKYYRVVHDGSSEIDMPPVPTVVLFLGGATLTRADGSKAEYDELLLNLFHEGTVIRKLYFRELQPEKVNETEVAPDDVTSFFNDEVMVVLANDIEDELNFNTYSQDEHFTRRAECIFELEEAMRGICGNDPLRLTADEAVSPNGTEGKLDNAKAIYAGPTIVQLAGRWRVVHEFKILKEGSEESTVNILSEHLQIVRYGL